jgi:hypothetical protein
LLLLAFGRTQESTRQLAMTRFRAVEHGRAAVQISAVGVSGIVGRSAFIPGVRRQERPPPARAGRPAPPGAGASGAGR